MGSPSSLSRRTVLKLGIATALPMPFVMPSYAKTSVSIGFFDHLVPQSNVVMREQVEEWSKASGNTVQADFITTSGNRLAMTAAAEAQAGVGHDVLAFSQWDVRNYADRLEPVDDVVSNLTGKLGQFHEAAAYLGKREGEWMAVPTTSGTLNFPVCARISKMKEIAGIDVRAMFPAEQVNIDLQAPEWNYDAFLDAAEKCKAAGAAFAIPIGQTSDAINPAGAMFAAHGADLVDAEGNITVGSDSVRTFLQWARRYVAALPDDAASYDDASNNRGLISGQSALIIGPPSAWATAKKDNPEVAQDCWTFPMPVGPKGRYVPAQVFYWGLWKFSEVKQPAKELMEFLMQRENIDQRATAANGYDIPPFPDLSGFEIWSKIEPPLGTLYNYPPRPAHKIIPHVAGAPAPLEVAVQIYQRAVMPGMLARLKSGQSDDAVIAWANTELEGFFR